MTLKRIIIVSIAICSTVGLFAQQVRARSPIPNWSYQDLRPYHFGFLLAANHMDFRIKMLDNYKENDTLFGVETLGTIGFTVGGIVNAKLHEYWDLRTGVFFSFGARRLVYSLRESPQRVMQMTKPIESTTMDIPVEIKWRGMRDRSLRPYVISGFRYSLDMASNARKKQHHDDPMDVVVKLHRDDFLFTTGVGFDFYLHHGNRIGVEIKMAFGMRDMLVRENNIFTNGIGRLTSRNLLIAINIE